jgi:hypothetical protein
MGKTGDRSLAPYLQIHRTMSFTCVLIVLAFSNSPEKGAVGNQANDIGIIID